MILLGNAIFDVVQETLRHQRVLVQVHQMRGLKEEIMTIIFFLCDQTNGAKNIKVLSNRDEHHTFFGEKTPTVPPSSLMATPISASRASLQRAHS